MTPDTHDMPVSEPTEIRVTRLESRVDSLDDKFDRIEHRLFGNGQAGLFEKMESKFDATVKGLSAEMKAEFSALKTDVTNQRLSFAKLVGYMAGSGILSSGVVYGIIKVFQGGTQ